MIRSLSFSLSLPSLCLLIFLCGCGNDPKGQKLIEADGPKIEDLEELQELATQSKEGVSLRSSLFKSSKGDYLIGYQLKTAEPGFYIYSLSHDSIKADGIGVATSIAIVPNGVVTSTGGFAESSESVVETNETLGIEYSIYPDGNVTIYQPVTLSAQKGEFEVQFSWQACMKSGICKSPVINFIVPHNMNLTE